MGIFNSIYAYKPVNKQASTVFNSGTRSLVSAKQLKKILKQKVKDEHTYIDDVFEAKCAIAAASRKADAELFKKARVKASGRKKGKRGVFGKLHW